MPEFNPLQYPLALSEMRYLSGESAWAGHLPFAQAIVEMARPRTLVELGTHHGDSYMGFCQAVADLGLEARCYAVDTWRGDAHAGAYDAAIYDRLRAVHDPAYGAFSTLLRTTFDDAVAQFPDAGIDLLHIDGLHTYEAVRHDYETWKPKLSLRGVVLFHDTAARYRGYGVWQLWDELKGAHPSFEFPHENGLGVLAVGPQAPTAVLDFIEAANRDPKRVRDYFKMLGDRYALLGIISRMSRTLQIAHAHAERWRARSGRPASPELQPQQGVLVLADAVLSDVKELTRPG